MHPPLLGVFHAYIESMTSISFESPYLYPTTGYSVDSETDVMFYLQSATVAAWETVKRMVPKEREFDLLSLGHLHLGGCVPDQSFCLISKSDDGSKKLTEFALIEYKAPGYVQGLERIFESLRTDQDVDAPEDWDSITRQIRKYAINTAAKDILLMDERLAIYFRFSNNPTDDDDTVEYLIVPCLGQPNANTDGAAKIITLRQLVAFMCWRALRRRGVTLKDFRHDGRSGAIVNEGYRPVMLRDPHSSAAQKRPHGGSGEASGMSRRTRSKYQHNAQGHDTIDLHVWGIGLPVTLKCLMDNPCGVEKKPPSDTGFYESYSAPSSSPPISPSQYQRPSCPPPIQPGENGQSTCTFLVERLITSKVAVLSSQSTNIPTRWVAKLFSDESVHEGLERERIAYMACRHLQGVEIPYMYGVWHFEYPVQPCCAIILIEYIDPGATIAEIRETARWGNTTQSDIAIARLDSLKSSGEKAINAIHESGVVHNDAYGRNLLVCGEGSSGRVVIADFDCAEAVGEFVAGTGAKGWGDVMQVRAAFRV